MNLPVLRKAIRFPSLSTTPISVRAVLPFDKGRVHFSTAFRLLQSGFNLFVRAEHRSCNRFLQHDLSLMFCESSHTPNHLAQHKMFDGDVLANRSAAERVLSRTLGDDAHCHVVFWGDALVLEFGRTQENLDIYHSPEYSPNKDDALEFAERWCQAGSESGAVDGVSGAVGQESGVVVRVGELFGVPQGAIDW